MLHSNTLSTTASQNIKPNSNALQPDNATYEFFLLACVRLLPEGETRSKLVARALELAKGRGLVTGQACREAYKANPDLVLQMFEVVSDTEHADFHQQPQIIIPADWCRTIHHKKGADCKVKLGPPAARDRPRSSTSNNYW